MTRTAIVTGATGFLGSHLTAALVERGWRVHVLVRPSSSLDRLAGCAPHLHVHVDDGTTEGLVSTIRELDVDVCFHLATNFVGRHDSADVMPLVVSNVAFPTRLAEALAAPQPPVFVNTGSIWQQVEGDAYRPAALYAATKQAFYDILRFYSEEGLLRVITLTLYDTYGPNDPRRKLLRLLRDAQRDGHELALSPGSQLIDLTYVDDIVNAFLVAADLAANGSDTFLRYTAASEAPVTIRRLVAVVEDVTGLPVPVRWGATPYRAREMMTYWKTDPRLPGWEPRIGLEEGIRRTWIA